MGILLTGSRTVFVLCAFNFIYLFIKNKKMRKPMFIMGMLLLIFVFLIFGISGSFDNMGRFLTINLQESTFVGRLLYDKDGLRLLLQHPMGLGYLGAYYLQPSFQTGVYTVRFLHNDWLQFAVDAGIIGALLHFAGLFSGIKKSDTVQKQLFITLFIGSLFDFNMQFMIMPMVLMMTLSFDKRCEVKKPVKRSAISTLLKLGCLGFIYFMVAFGSVYFDHYTLATKMYVGNTEAKITLLQLAENKEALNQSANAVISQNKHIALAYDAKAMISQADHHYDSMLFFKEKAIENKKYDIKEYESYLQMLSTAIEAENAVGNRVKVEEYATKVFEIPEMLKKVEAQTDPLA
ncbi:MAG: O-antigen ligase family protein, partial [Eubacterium sp.]